MSLNLSISKNWDESKAIITHEYPYDVALVYKAFINTNYIEQWWAPLPYKAIVVSNDALSNGSLFYYMLSPEGEKHYCMANFFDVAVNSHYKVIDAFCDANKNINVAMPSTEWHSNFEYSNGITTITQVLHYKNKEQMQMIFEMGFEQGYTATLHQLYNLLGEWTTKNI
jgi:uncharacterized protein YndB with AHSA1/START domain